MSPPFPPEGLSPSPKQDPKFCRVWPGIWKEEEKKPKAKSQHVPALPVQPAGPPPAPGTAGVEPVPKSLFPSGMGQEKPGKNTLGSLGWRSRVRPCVHPVLDLGSGNGVAPKADPKQLIPNSSSQRLIPSVPGLGAPHSWDTGCALTRHLPSPKACGTGSSGTGPLPGGRNPKSAEWGRAGLSLLFPPASILSSFPWVE